MKNGDGTVINGNDGKPDTSLMMSESDFLALVKGKLNTMQAFMQGRLKISGNMMLAQKLQAVFTKQSKL